VYRLLIFAVLVVASDTVESSACLAEQTNEKRTSSALLQPKNDVRSIFNCEAVLKVEPTTVAIGGEFRIVCEVIGHREPNDLFNGFLSERFKLPAQILITSTDGDLRREVLHCPEGASEKVGLHCWQYVRRGRTIGRELIVKVGKVTSAIQIDSRLRAIDLPPGEYHVQVIYNHWLVAKWLNRPSYAGRRPTDGTENEPRPLEWAADKMNEPLAISKPVKIVVTSEVVRKNDVEQPSGKSLQLDLGRPEVKETPEGPRAILRMRMTNRANETITVFNPFLDTRFFFEAKVMDLAILRPTDQLVGNYMDEFAGSSGRPTIRDWATVPPGGTVSSEFAFAPEHVPQTDFSSRRKLPAGKYLLEMHGRAALLQPPPLIFAETNDASAIATDPGYQEWRRAFPGPEICRSNRVELEILPRTGD